MLGDIHIFLPKYLSPSDQSRLTNDVLEFPGNIDGGRFYSSFGLLPNIIYQGDGLNKLPIHDFETNETRKNLCIIFSNTCDIDLNNNRMVPSKVVYAPVIKIEKYLRILEEEGVPDQKRSDHIEAIKQQKVTQIFYLPQSNAPESIVFLDMIQSCPNPMVDRSRLPTTRMFSLSQYGHYVFLFKISMHFCRLNEGVARN